MRREGETKQRSGAEREGPPDLDLDLVEEEALEEERRRKRHRARQEKGTHSRSLPRNPRSQERDEELDAAVMGRRRRHSEGARGPRAKAPGGEREDQRTSTSHSRGSGGSAPGQRSAFSFLRPMDDEEEEHASDSESATSFSEVSLSAASVTTAGWRDDWGAGSPWEQRRGPGPWLKPSPQRLTQVLIGSRLSGQRLAGGLSL